MLIIIAVVMVTTDGALPCQRPQTAVEHCVGTDDDAGRQDEPDDRLKMYERFDVQ